MRIFVCVKPVPDTAARIKVGDGAKIDPSGVKFVLGPYDSRACAKAVELRDAAGEGAELIAVTAGAKKGEREAKKRLKDALALGADKGIIVTDDDPENRDPRSVAKGLAEAIKGAGEFSLVLLGRQAMDDQAMAVGPMLAVYLDAPCVTDAVGLEVSGDTATVTRAAEGRTETLEVKLPAVITCQRDLAEEKYPKLKEILKAGKKPMDTVDFAWPEAAYQVTGLEMPPEPVAGKIVGEGPDAVPELLNLLQNEAKKLSF
jgi:electron transfer flavoprotein beta subunit